MACIFTKEDLYTNIELFRNDCLGVDFNDYPLNLFEMCSKCEFISLEAVPFKTLSLRGMAVPSHSENKNDIIIINSNRSQDEYNFVCAHELVHLGFHRNEDCKSFSCFDDVRENQDSFLEWHANEGGAEIVVPYKMFLPKIKDAFNTFTNWTSIANFKEQMAIEFNVTESVIQLRLENLKYEIHQYLNGTSLQDIEILSANEQSKKNIKIESINDIQNNYIFLYDNADNDIFLDEIELATLY